MITVIYTWTLQEHTGTIYQSLWNVLNFLFSSADTDAPTRPQLVSLPSHWPAKMAPAHLGWGIRKLGINGKGKTAIPVFIGFWRSLFAVFCFKIPICSPVQSRESCFSVSMWCGKHNNINNTPSHHFILKKITIPNISQKEITGIFLWLCKNSGCYLLLI